MSLPPASIPGKFVMFATINAVDKAAADKLEPLLKAERDFVIKNEKGCLTYRVLRGVDDETTRFNVFEEYETAEDLKKHRESEPFKTLFSHADLIASRDRTYSAEL